MRYEHNPIRKKFLARFETLTLEQRRTEVSAILHFLLGVPVAEDRVDDAPGQGNNDDNSIDFIDGDLL